MIDIKKILGIGLTEGYLEVRKNGKWEKLDYIIVEPLADVFNKRLKEKGLFNKKK